MIKELVNKFKESFKHIRALFSPKTKEYKVANVNTSFVIDVDKYVYK